MELTIDHRVGFPVGAQLHCVVSGVLGTTSANGIRVAEIKSTTSSTTTLNLYSRDDNTASGLAPVTLNAAWTGGGTLQSAFADGRILLGPEHVRMHSAPPRIIVVPRSSSPIYGRNPRDHTAGAVARMMRYPPVLVDSIGFDVHIWAAQYLDGLLSPNPDYDYDYLEMLYGAFAYAVTDMALTSARFEPGIWSESDPDATQDVLLGRRLQASLVLDIPLRPATVVAGVLPAGTVDYHAGIAYSPSSPTGPQSVPMEIP
jgi:hypothetical protein